MPAPKSKNTPATAATPGVMEINILIKILFKARARENHFSVIHSN